VAGAHSARLGGADKALIEVGGLPLLGHAVAAVRRAQRIVVVGPRREVARDVTWCEEDPPNGGPVAAFAAGLRHTGADVVVLIAVDLPFVGPAVAPLLRAVGEADVAALVDSEGRTNYLAAAWRRAAAVRLLDAIGSPNGVSMRRLTADADLVRVVDEAGWSLDCDTWEGVEVARARAASPSAEGT
jgi:molybdopterin-guanine dinucleotide biosynthesis protein A